MISYEPPLLPAGPPPQRLEVLDTAREPRLGFKITLEPIPAVCGNVHDAVKQFDIRMLVRATNDP
jgi:hypothetical protein